MCIPNDSPRETQREQVIRWAMEQFGVEPEYPWADSPEAFVLRHPNSGKWFGVVMAVGRDRLGLPGEGRTDILNLKMDPLLLGSLLEMPGFCPAYHMNKLHWVSLVLDGPLGEEDILPLLSMSYENVAPKGRKKGGKKP